jgi:hypothetical protein
MSNRECAFAFATRVWKHVRVLFRAFNADLEMHYAMYSGRLEYFC